MAETAREFLKARESADIEHRFTYHQPVGDQNDRYTVVRATARSLAHVILDNVTDGRERSLALTKLEEAIFWANAGIARERKER